MLRSILIGFALAALLQVGVHTASPAANLTSTAQGGDWSKLECSAAVLINFVTHGFTARTR